MKFGINFFPTCDPERKSATDYFAEALDLCERGDELGYHTVKIVEHYCSPYGGYSPAPLIFLSAASQRTRRLRLMTGAVVPAFTHPVKLAAELAMADAISGGRLDVGFARAFLPHEFEAFEVSMDESRARFEEGVEAVMRLWTEESVTFEGRFHRFEDVSLLPRPQQSPHPPTRVAAVSTPESFRWAGEHGHGLMVVPYLSEYDQLNERLELYRESFRRTQDREPAPVCVVLHVYLAEDDKDARREAHPLMEHHVAVAKAATSSWATHRSDQYRGYEAIVRKLEELSFERMCGERRILVGDPATVRGQVRDLDDLFGDIQLDLNIAYGDMPHDRAARNLELFAAEVMPAFHDDPGMEMQQTETGQHTNGDPAPKLPKA